MARWVLHVDLDQFIAAVEVLRRPELRGLAIVVGGDGDPSKRGVVATASYEARQHGVHSGLPMRTAVRRCPDAVFLPVDREAYEAVSERVMDALRELVAVARIMPAVVQVESHPYLPEWELLDFCRENGIVLLAFAPLGHALQPNLLEDNVITDIAKRLQMSPAQVALSWAAQRGCAFLTTSTKPHRISENYQISSLPDDAMSEIRDHITTNIRFNSVVQTGVPGFIPRPT